MTAPDLITEARTLTASIATDSLRSLQDTQLARARMLLEDMADALEAAQRPPDELIKLRRLLTEFVDPGGDSVCRFDHHGGCQEHGHSIEPGEMCPDIEARQYLSGVREVPDVR